MFPTLIRIGDFHLATYGLLVALGYLWGILWLNSRREELGLSEDRFWGLIYAIFFGAIVGGKTLYWIVEWDQLVSGELGLLRDIRFGFVFFGGLIGVLVMGFWYTRKHRLNFLLLADYFLAALPLGHALGRLGCFMAGCCGGLPTAMPWGVRFTHPESLVPLSLRAIPLHPTQLYEAGANLLLWFFLARILDRTRKKELAQGTVLLTYVGLYSVVRFVIEFFRGDDRGAFILNLSPSQWLALAGAASAVYFLKGLRRCP